MVNKQNEKTQALKGNVIHNFSWFPSILLLFQLFLLLFELFKLKHGLIDAFNQFIQESSLFLTVVNGLLIPWYWKKGAILNRKDVGKQFKFTNSCFCVANIVLLNKLYSNNKINDFFSSVSEFLSGEDLSIYVFVLVIAVIVLFIVRYARRSTKNAAVVEEQHATPASKSAIMEEPQQLDSEKNSGATNGAPSQSAPKTKDKSATVLFFSIFTGLFAIIVAVVYVLIKEYDVVANIINGSDNGSNILAYLLIAISAVALIIVLIILVAAAAQSISQFFYKIPEYIHGTAKPDDKITKIAFGIVLIPVFYGITKLFGIGTDWLLNLLHNQDFLVVPFLALLYFVFSMLFVEVLYRLFSGNHRAKWLKKFSEIISETGDSIVDICNGIITSFFRLIQFIPDFLESIEELLLGEKNDGRDVPDEHPPTHSETDKENHGKDEMQ